METRWIKCHLLDILFGQECQVEDDSDKVTLSAVVGGIIIPINDEILSVIQVSSIVLEKLGVHGVSKDVIRMDSLKVVMIIEFAFS